MWPFKVVELAGGEGKPAIQVRVKGELKQLQPQEVRASPSTSRRDATAAGRHAKRAKWARRRASLAAGVVDGAG